VHADAATASIEGPFDAACSFLAFEYVDDLPALLRRLAGLIRPGGVLYFITARRSFFRLFTQIGNAMRQGLWLRARSRREVARMLADAGFGRVDVRTHLLKSAISGGMLLEVCARRDAAPPGGPGSAS
jgi:SAM-dependent methyltransferase